MPNTRCTAKLTRIVLQVVTVECIFDLLGCMYHHVDNAIPWARLVGTTLQESALLPWRKSTPACRSGCRDLKLRGVLALPWVLCSAYWYCCGLPS